MPGESQVARGGELARPGRQLVGPAGEGGDLPGHGGVRRRLEVGGVPVVPAAVVPPDVADHELGLVVDRPQVRLVEQGLRCTHRVDDLVETGARVHHAQRVVVQGLEELGGVLERLADSIDTEDGEAVSGEQRLGAEPGHRPQRDRPVLGVPLHLLGVPAVG